MYILVYNKKKNRKNLGKIGLVVYMENLVSNLGIDIVIVCIKLIFFIFSKGWLVVLKYVLSVIVIVISDFIMRLWLLVCFILGRVLYFVKSVICGFLVLLLYIVLKFVGRINFLFICGNLYLFKILVIALWVLNFSWASLGLD